MSLINLIKESTAKYLGTFGVEAGNLDYITEDLIFASVNAVPATAKAFQNSAASVDTETQRVFSSEKLLFGQWSGYIYDVVEYSDKITFYTSCGVTGTPQYTVYKSNIVSIKYAGLCYQYSLYYLVCNI